MKNHPINARSELRPKHTMSAPCRAAQSSRPSPAKRTIEPTLKRACAGVGVSSSSTAGPAAFAVAACLLPPLRKNCGAHRPPAKPISAAATTITGKGTAKNTVATNAPIATAIKGAVRTVREPIR